MASEFEGMISRLMSDPEVMKAVSSLGAGFGAAAGSAQQGDMTEPEQGALRSGEMPQTPDFGAMLNQMMQNPEIMNIVNKMNNYSSASQPPQSEPMQEKSGFSGIEKPNRRDRERIALLSALRPYLSENRCRKIDGIVKMLELIEFARATHLLDSIIPNIGFSGNPGHAGHTEMR